MVMSPYEWKILEWDDKFQTNKQTKINFVNVFLLLRNYLPLENDLALHLNKLVSPLLKDALYQVGWI